MSTKHENGDASAPPAGLSPEQERRGTRTLAYLLLAFLALIVLIVANELIGRM